MKSQIYTDNQVEWLKNNMEAEFQSVREAVNKVEATNKEAVTKVENNYAEYRSNQNEWRGTFNDQANNFARKEVLEAQRNANANAIEELKKAIADSFKSIEKAFETGQEMLNGRLTKLEMMRSNMEGRMWGIGAFISVIVILVNWYFSSRK